MERPARRLDQAAFQLSLQAVRIDHFTGIGSDKTTIEADIGGIVDLQFYGDSGVGLRVLVTGERDPLALAVGPGRPAPNEALRGSFVHGSRAVIVAVIWNDAVLAAFTSTRLVSSARLNLLWLVCSFAVMVAGCPLVFRTL